MQVGDRGKLELAHQLWKTSRGLEQSDPVDLYLRGRALVPPAEYGIGDAAVSGGWPVDLRFLPRAWHYLEERHYPVMLAAIRAADGTLLTVHRTYLEQRRDGRWGKAAIDKPKLVVGSYGPGYILLGPVTASMVGGEGSESSMSAMQLWRRSGLAFVTAGRMRTVEPPFECDDFTYAADKGGKDRAGERAARAGVAAEFNIGRRVRMRLPNLAAPDGDFNDFIQAVARGEDPSAPPTPPAAPVSSSPNAVRQGRACCRKPRAT